MERTKVRRGRGLYVFNCESCERRTLPFNPWDEEKKRDYWVRAARRADRRIAERRQFRMMP